MTEEKSKMSIATFYRRVKFLCNGLFILTVVWITLTLYHQYLLHKLSVFTTENHIIDSKILEKNLRSLKQIFSKIIIDSGGMYRILHNVHKARNDVYRREFNKSVTLVTHCSVNHVTKIISLANIWSGPIILTVFIPNSGFVYGLEKISYMLKCTREQLKNVTVHVVTDFTTFQELFPLDIERVQQILCNDSMQKNLTQWKRNYALEASEYPNNLLRNIGIQTASSEYVFTIDIDMIPSSNFYNYLSKFLHQSSTDIVKTVYVIPAFEIESKSPMPVDKKKLLEMWNNRLIRPFYLELCDKCQRPTDYQQWRALPSSDSEIVKIAYSVKWKDPWEPYFVSPASMPLFDERFRQYGFNRISQVCELHIAGYEFSVLNNLFIVHQGFKKPDQFHESKDREQNRNRLLFRQFKQELKIKYPDSSRRCY